MENEIILDYDFLKSVLHDYYQSKYPNREIEINFYFKKYTRQHSEAWNCDGGYYTQEELVCDVYLSYQTVVFGKNTTMKDHIFLDEYKLMSILEENLNERLAQNNSELEIDCIFAREKDAQIMLSTKKELQNGKVKKI